MVESRSPLLVTGPRVRDRFVGCFFFGSGLFANGAVNRVAAVARACVPRFDRRLDVPSSTRFLFVDVLGAAHLMPGFFVLVRGLDRGRRVAVVMRISR
jgi:hypothetical protein